MSQTPFPDPAQQPGGRPGPGQPHGGAPAGVGGDERSMMLVAHLSAPVATLVSAGWLPFLGPLLVWLLYKDRSPAVRTAAAGAFNFNVSLTIIYWLLWLSVIVTFFVGLLWAVPAWIVLFVVQVWVHVKAVLRATSGQVYRYPLQLRILG